MEFTEPIMRPPQEAHSLLLRATEGCSYNACNFCYVSRGYQFRAVSPEYLEQEILRYKPFFPADTNVYLTGSNPFALPTETLQTYIATLRRHFPLFQELSTQSRIDDITRKTPEELQLLASLGLTHLYIGVENGNDQTLKFMNKGYTAAEAINALHLLDEAKISYTNFYVLGLGGQGLGKQCGLDTAKMFNQVHPRRITTTGMTIFKDTPLAQMVAAGTFKEPSEREKIEELGIFLENLTIDTFYDGVHYLNPLNYRFQTGNTQEKTKVLKDIQDVLNEYSTKELELMVNRKMMVSL